MPQVYKANPSHVLEVAYIAVCVNLLWDLWGAVLYTSLGLSRGDSFKNLMIIQLLPQELKETQASVLVLAGESKKEGVCGLEACTWSCQ